MATEIDRPIFLMGPGRSGTTLMLRLATLNKQAAYFSNWTNRYPQLPQLAFLSRFRLKRLEANMWTFKGMPKPGETYRIWNWCFDDFWIKSYSKCIDEAGAEKLKSIIRVHLQAQGGVRFLTKVTGPSMTEFLRSIFPDAKYVWIDRDPRAVCYSTFKRAGPRVPLAALRHPDLGIAEDLDHLRWVAIPRRLLDPMEELAYIADRYINIYQRFLEHRQSFYNLRYRDFITDPTGEIKKMNDYLGLETNETQVNLIEKWSIDKRRDQAWQSGLNDEQKNLLEHILAQPLGDEGWLA